MLLELREPISALSHGVGMMLALPLTWIFWERARSPLRDTSGDDRVTHYQRGKRATLVLYGLTLVICFGSSALYHSVRLSGEALGWYRRLDHVGIYLLIAGTYTPATWSLFRRRWRHGTLSVVWSVAAFCSARVWLGGVLPIWLSTTIYMTMGWGVLICYRELARSLSHRTLLPLPLGGVLYSMGALINLRGWPVPLPGVFGSHELFHLFVLAGSGCHAAFMMRVVVPCRQPGHWDEAATASWSVPRAVPVAGGKRPRRHADAALSGQALFGRVHLTSSLPLARSVETPSGQPGRADEA